MVALTTVQITNVTGKPARFVDYHDYHGHIRTAYPEVIANGETVYFVFENQNGDQSSGAVAYEGETEESGKFQWLYAWRNVNGEEPDKYKAYTEIADTPKDWNWTAIAIKLIASGPSSNAKHEGCVSHAVISQPLYPVIYQGKMSLAAEGGSKT